MQEEKGKKFGEKVLKVDSINLPVVSFITKTEQRKRLCSYVGMHTVDVKALKFTWRRI